jgi:hypothetical protein
MSLAQIRHALGGDPEPDVFDFLNEHRNTALMKIAKRLNILPYQLLSLPTQDVISQLEAEGVFVLTHQLEQILINFINGDK